jgi:type II secretion system protein N
MNPRLQRVLTWVGYPVFYLFALVVFSYLTAPYERLKNALVAGFNTGDAPLRLELDELTWSWRFPGIAGSGGRFIGETPPADDSGKKAPRPEYNVDDFHVRLSVLPLLVGTTSVTFGFDGFGGDVSGAASDGSDEKSLELEMSDIVAAQLPYLSDLIGLPIQGTVAANVDLVLPEGELGKADGELQLDIEDFKLGDGKAKIRGTIALPQVDAGLFSLSATIEEGRLTIEQFSAKGTDLEVVADGKIRLLDKPENSLVEMDLRFKFSDKYKSQSDVTKALFGSPESKVPGVFDLDPQIKKAKRDDGFYAWRLTGPLSKLNFQPAAKSRRASAKPAAKRKRPARTKRKPRVPKFAPPPRRKPTPAPRAAPPPRPPPPPKPNPPLTPAPAPPAPAAEPEADDEDEDVDEEEASDDEAAAGEESADEESADEEDDVADESEAAEEE